jgi:MFS family permease
LNFKGFREGTLLDGNARICIAFHPLWAIPYSVYMYFLGLYLTERGITDSQLGTLMMAGSIAGLFSSLIAAPIIDKFGRRNTTLLFDLVSSAIPPLLFLFAGSYALALVAVLLANLNRILGIAYYLLMIEDSDDRGKVNAMNLFNLILVAAGFMIAPAGLLTGRIGLVKAQRLFLSVASLSVVSIALTRHFMVKETTEGLAAMRRSKGLPTSKITGDETIIVGKSSFLLTNLLAGFLASFRFLSANPAAARAMRTNILFYVYYAVGSSASLYFALYFTRHLGLSKTQASMIGGLYAMGTLLAMFFINPFFTRRGSAWFIRIASLISIGGFLLLVFSPRMSFPWAAIGTLFLSLGFGMLKTAADAVLALETHGGERAGLYALSNLCAAVLTALVLWLCSRLFTVNPAWLFILTTVIVVGILLNQGKNYVEPSL